MRNILLSLAAVTVVTVGAADLAPYGSKHFYPSPDRPVGYRGDGSGWFPGATPVAEWWEGDPKLAQIPYDDKYGVRKIGMGWTFPAMDTPEGNKNIAWKTETPAWGNSAPIVVGDRIFCTVEPYGLACFDANTGKQLWTRDADPWSCAGLPEEKAATLRALYMLYLAAWDFRDAQYRERNPCFNLEQYGPMVEIYATIDGPKMVAELQKLDPGTDYQAAFDATIKALRAFLPHMAEKEAFVQARREGDAFHSLIGQRIAKLAGMGVLLPLPWGPQMGFCMSSPVSDGERVYVSYGQGQTACYDLHGNRVWGAWKKQSNNIKLTGDAIRSPMLADGLLITVNDSDASAFSKPSVLRAFDAKTGELKWETPVDVSGIGSDKVVTLGTGDAVQKVVVGMRGWVVRVKDGKLLATIPYKEVAGGGTSRSSCSMVAIADPATPGARIVYMSGQGDNYNKPFTAFRLTLDGADAVRTEKVWDLGPGSACGLAGILAADKLLVLPSRKGNFFDGVTGQPTTARIADLPNGAEATSLIQAGHLVIFHQADQDYMGSHWGVRRPDGLTAKRFFVYDVSDPLKPVPKAARNVLGGKNWPRVSWQERWTPGLYNNPNYFGQWGGKPGHMLHLDTGITAQGNRLFIRTTGHVYCIGDPSVPYDWDPASKMLR